MILNLSRVDLDWVEGRYFFMMRVVRLEQGAQKSWGCPITGSFQGQVGWDIEQPDLVKAVPACCKEGWN